MIFSLELEIYVVAVQRIHQKSDATDSGFWEEFLSENKFEAILATFCCYDYDANATEAVQKFAADQKDYHKCSSCVIVCWIVNIYQLVTVNKGWLLTYCTRTPPA